MLREISLGCGIAVRFKPEDLERVAAALAASTLKPEEYAFYAVTGRGDHLKALSDSGTEILVCGTCLNFYGITDQLKVGAVSNMYDIVTRMQKAAKVISL